MEISDSQNKGISKIKITQRENVIVLPTKIHACFPLFCLHRKNFICPEINSILNICGSFCLHEQINPNCISWGNCEINCVDIYLGRKQLTQCDRVMIVTENSEALEKELFSSHYVCLIITTNSSALGWTPHIITFLHIFWKRKHNKVKSVD